MSDALTSLLALAIPAAGFAVFELQALTGDSGVCWLIYFLFLPLWILFPVGLMGPAGLAVSCVHLLGYPLARLALARTAWGRRVLENAAKRKTPPGWPGAGSGPGLTSGGGGFSGGGGSFGGGGASGSW